MTGSLTGGHGLTVAKRRRLEREQRRAEILEAAQRVFTEHGLARATMGQVAAEARLSKGTLYLYFHSKDELFMGLAAEVLDAAREVMAPIAEDEGRSGLVAFRDMASEYTKVALSKPHTIRNALIWFASGDLVDTETEGFRTYRQKIGATQSLIFAVLSRGQADGSVREDLDLGTTLAQIWPSLISAVVMRFNIDEVERRLEQQVDRDLLVPGLIEILTRGIARCPDSVEKCK